MSYVVAVSGGVDSVALLDMMAKALPGSVVVAHFDHGIRPDSKEDAAFVRRLAERYKLPFETRREELGEMASEALARERRYAFLREVADKHQAKIVAAHHGDDVAETIAINLLRGTGWRGLAVLDSDVVRPLLHMNKADIKRYALQNGLRWREDSTNSDDAYLRNRVRPHVENLPSEHVEKLRDLHFAQRNLKKEIEREVRKIVGEGPRYSRYQFIHMPASLAAECLRVVTGGKLTRPQLERAVLAIKTAHSGSAHQVGGGVTLHFSSRYFTL